MGRPSLSRGLLRQRGVMPLPGAQAHQVPPGALGAPARAALMVIS